MRGKFAKCLQIATYAYNWQVHNIMESPIDLQDWGVVYVWFEFTALYSILAYDLQLNDMKDIFLKQQLNFSSIFAFNVQDVIVLSSSSFLWDETGLECSIL